MDAQARIHRAANTPGSGAQELATYFVGQVVDQMNSRKRASQVVLTGGEDYADAIQRFTSEVAEATGVDVR